MWSAVVRTPKRHIFARFRVIWAIVRQNWPTGHFSRRLVWKKMKIKKKRPYIWRIWLYAPLWPIYTKFALRVCLMDINNCAKFYRNRLRGLEFVGSNFDHSHRNAMSPLTQGGTNVRLWYHIISSTILLRAQKLTRELASKRSRAMSSVQQTETY